MTGFEPLFKDAKVKWDFKVKHERIKVKEEVEEFFEKNHINLIDYPLFNIIREMERKASTEFIDHRTYDKDISFESDFFKTEFKKTLSKLIKDKLKKLSPDYCNYDVKVEETVHYNLSIEITMTICE